MTKILFAGARDPFSEIETRYPSLWPAYLSAMLEKHLPSETFEFNMVNGDYKENLESFKPDIVAISSVTQNYNIAKRICKNCQGNGAACCYRGATHNCPSRMSFP